MARFARIVAPGCPHHVTARGNRREPVFFEDGDQDIYRDLLSEQMRKAEVEVWAYCLMPNHVHLILCPSTADGMARALGAAHRRWANFINARGRWRGHLFDGRFASVVMDEAHLHAAIRYVALNPVRARLVARAADWPWSSARAHLAGEDDGLVTVRPVLDRVESFAPGSTCCVAPMVRCTPAGRPTSNAGSAAPSPGARPAGSWLSSRRGSLRCSKQTRGIVLLSP